MKRCLPFSSLVSTGVTPVLFKQSPISTSSFPLFCLWLQTPPLLMFPFRPILTNLFSASLLRTYPCLIRKSRWHENQDNDKIEMISYISNMKTQTCYLLLHSYTLLYDQCTHDGPIYVQNIKDYLDDSL